MTLNRLIQPPLNSIAGLPDFKIEKTLLKNNIPLHYINAGSEEMLKLQITFHAGMKHQHKNLQAYFCGKMLKEGTNSHTAAEIAEIIDFYGAYLDIKVNRDQSIIHLITLNKHLSHLLSLISEFILEPTFPEKELKIMAEQEKQSFLHRLQKVKVQAQKAFGAQLFGPDHPYGRHAETEDFSNINVGDLKSFFKEHYQISKAHVYMSGLITEEVLQTLNQHFGVWHLNKLNEENEEQVFPTALQNKSLHLVEKNNALQTALKIGRLCPNRNEADFPAFTLTQTILGGFFGSRLMQNIREDKGYTYGIYSNIQHLQYASIFSIASEVGSDVSELAIKEIDKELIRLQEELVNEEELSLVKNYMSGSLLRSLNGPFALGEMIKTIEEFDLEDQYYQHFLKEIHQISSEEVQKMAQKYFSLTDMTLVKVGK